MTQQKPKQGRRHWSWWLLALLALDFVLCFVVPSPMVAAGIATEMHSTDVELGSTQRAAIERRGLQWYAEVVENTGFRAWFIHMVIPRQHGINSEVAVGNDRAVPWMRMFAENFLAGLQEIFVRLAMIAVWWPLAVMLVVPVVIDARALWKRRQWSFEYASPNVHGASMRAFFLLMVVLVFAPLVPLPIPPLLFPAAIGLSALMIWFWMINTQKRI